ncbi:hypothetical protein Hanom_Chr05g00420271 [Helianthus anomalus]
MTCWPLTFQTTNGNPNFHVRCQKQSHSYGKVTPSVCLSQNKQLTDYYPNQNVGIKCFETTLLK